MNMVINNASLYILRWKNNDQSFYQNAEYKNERKFKEDTQ